MRSKARSLLEACDIHTYIQTTLHTDVQCIYIIIIIYKLYTLAHIVKDDARVTVAELADLSTRGLDVVLGQPPERGRGGSMAVLRMRRN